MIRWIGANLRTFLWAFILASAVWIAAVSAADPDEMRQYPTPIPIEIVGQDPGLVLTGEYPTQIDLTLRAPKSVWEQLLSDENQVRAILDLSGISNGNHTLDIRIQITPQPVRIVSATPETAIVTLELLDTRTLPIELNLIGEPAIGYKAGEANLTPVEIVISGPQSLVEQAAKIRVSASLTNARESIDQSLPVQVLDENNLPISGLSLNPSNVRVTLPISQQGGYRDLAVKVVVTGQVANGYRLTNISVFPPIVTVFSGDPLLVNNLPGVLETTPLDLDNANTDQTRRLALALPDGISVVGEQTVLVQVDISPIQSSMSLSNMVIEIIGLQTGLAAQLSPDTVDVIISGPLPSLDTLRPQDVRVTVDLSGLGEGTHQVTPVVEILIADVVVESILPGTVEVTIGKAGTIKPTPTPTLLP